MSTKLASVPTQVAALSLQEKFTSLEVALKSEILERSEEIRTALVALIAGVHHIQIGSPGTAKTFLVRRLALRVDGLTDEDLFIWLLTKYDTPENLFGPPSLKGLEQDVYRRNTSGKLPRAKLAFLDETFKANSSILNALLTIMNEREFQNPGDDPNVPLRTLFGASNELPAGEELSALWDRCHFRHHIHPIVDGGNFIKMLSMKHDPNPPKLLGWHDIIAASDEAEAVTLSVDILEALKTLRDALKAEGIEPTERRFMDSLRIVRATAWLNGRTDADIDDMRLLGHVMWSRIDDQKIVRKIVLDLANPLDREAGDLLEEVEALGEQLLEAINNSDSPKALAQRAVEIHSKMQKAKTDIGILRKKCQAHGRSSEVLDHLQSRFDTIAARLMRDAFGLNVSGIDQPV